jgi:hypothetical protein
MRRLHAVVDQIKSAGGHAVARAFDITKVASYEQLIDFTVKELGGPGRIIQRRRRSFGEQYWQGYRRPSSARDEEIRRRAYEIYLERGEQPGRESGDWL